MQITNTKQFIDLFNFTEESGYYNPVHLQDEEIGFSIKKKYPTDIRFKPTLKQNGEPDDIMVIWLVFHLHKSLKTGSNSKKYPIYIKINKYSLYRTKYFDYNFDDEESPTEVSLSVSKNTPQPLELEYFSDFFFDDALNCFVDNKGNLLTGIEMLNSVVKQHLNTVHIIKGFKIRTKIFAKSNVAGIFTLLIKILIFLLKYPFGRLLKDSDSELSLYHGFNNEDMKRITTDTVEIFKYHASKHVITTFCIIIIFISSIDYFFKLNSSYLKYITSNNLMIVTYSITLLLILDILIPQVLFHLINALVSLRNKIIFRKLKL
jgi:hypothetical protein